MQNPMKFLSSCSWMPAALAVAIGCRSPGPISPPSRDASSPASFKDASVEEIDRDVRTVESQGTSRDGFLEAPLDLETALALADQHHPGIRTAHARLAAAAGRVIQAGIWLNPRLEAAMESAPFEGRTTGDAEYIVGASQTLPIGGRLGAATRVARAEETRRSHELNAVRRRVHGEVRRSFFAVLYAERLVAVERELLDTAESVVTIARARVSAGESIPEEVARAELEAEGLRLQHQRAEAAREEARILLAESMGRADMRVSGVEGDLYASLEVPLLEELLERIDDHPELLAAGARTDESEARLRLAQLERIPDIDLGVAYHRFAQTHTDAFDVGFGVPLPLFGRNQGTIAEARANVAAARAEVRSRRMSLQTRARLVHQKLTQALRSVSTYREELIPRARTVLASAEARYEAGDASLAEILPVRRDAARLELEALEAVRELVMRWSELKALAAVPGS